ncbi:MAG: hypothetical protein K6T83_02675 [Alicyclobacillus sp.]|nr:hypothetical protein [Alicyclobacillus sp.]
MKLSRIHKAFGVGAGVTLALSTLAVPSAFAGSTTYAYAGGWNTNGIINPASSNNIVDNGIAYAPLAYFKFTGNFDYWPVLAKSWSFNAKANTLTVHINPNAKWSNGTPVTAQDVLVTFELQFLQGNAQNWTLTNVKVVDPHTVVFYKDPHALYNNSTFMQQILNNTSILPAAIYGKYIPKNIWQLVKDAQGDPKAKSTVAASKAMTAAITKATGVKYTPSQLIYDGPWSLVRTSSSTILYTKNPYYVFAKNINADQVVETNQTTNDVTWRALENGQLDYAGVGYSPVVYKAVMSVHQNHFIAVPQSTGMALLFNQGIAPFNDVRVRQALAYIINRSAVQKIGEPIGGYKAVYEDGLIETVNKQWLTPAQLKTLNQYNPNKAKATALLKAAGFKKTSSGWVMPNGKPFKFNVYVPNYSDWVQGVDAITSELQQFGIQASTSVTDPNLFYDQAGKGKYGVFTEWWGGWSLDPAQAFNQLYLQHDNFSVTTTGQLKAGTGPSELQFAQPMTVQGMGKVFPAELDVKLLGNLSLSAEKQTIYKLAKITNTYLPLIPIWSQAAGRTWSTERWIWPDFQKNQALENQFVYQNPFVVFDALGLMKPKQ